jgi:murein DD-endopeptidase MepM/ murein hydrolase activator NlpD
MVKQANHWWMRMAAALLAAFSLMGWIIAKTPQLSAQTAGISDDALFTAETGFTPLEIQKLLEQRGSPLAGYMEIVGDQTMSAAELFWAASQHADYGFNPRALLTTLYLEDGLNWTQPGGLYAHLKQIALQLQRAAQAAQAPATPDGAKTTGPAQSTAISALSEYYAPHAKVAGQVRASLQQWSDAYRQLFDADPAAAYISKSPTTNVPFLRLPFAEPAQSFYPVESFFDHYYPGQLSEPNMLRADGRALPGAHYTACWRGMTCYSGHNAIDFTLPSGTPVVAAAAGKVIYTLPSEGGILIDHGNGYRTVYWHLDKIIVNMDQNVADGELLGWSDCRGTCSKPHLHFGLRLVALSQDVDPYGWWSIYKDPVPGPSQYMWRGDLLADNGEAQTQLFYDQYWVYDPEGYGGESWYTYSTNDLGLSTNWGMWGATIPAAGEYTVSAYWPKNAENTTGAVYQVWHAGGMTPVTVNQRMDGDHFFPLGTFQFDAGPIVVILTDLTSEAAKDQRVYFDAVRWEPVPVQRTFYIPYLQSDIQADPPSAAP